MERGWVADQPPQLGNGAAFGLYLLPSVISTHCGWLRTTQPRSNAIEFPAVSGGTPSQIGRGSAVFGR